MPSLAYRGTALCFLAVALVAVTALGCRRGDEHSGSVFRDSAGVRIVDNIEPRWSTPRLVIDATPAVVIGESSDSSDLYTVTSVIVLPDGRIAVANAGSSQVQLHAPNGRLMRVLGRKGEGPGEFEHPRWLQVWRDTLVVYDPFLDNGRISYFTLDGEFLTTGRMVVDGLTFPNPRALLPDGTLLDERAEGSIPAAQAGYVRYTRYVIRYPRDGSRIDTIASGPGTETMRVAVSGGMVQLPVPYGRTALTAVRDSVLYIGNGDSFVIESYRLDGSRVASIRAPPRATRVTSAHVQSWIEQSLSNPRLRRRPEMVTLARRQYEAAPVPGTMPEYDALLADGVGRLWVRLYTPPGTPSVHWRVFEPDGSWLTDVTMPGGLEPHYIGADYVIGVGKDELDLERVQLHRMSIATA